MPVLDEPGIEVEAPGVWLWLEEPRVEPGGQLVVAFGVEVRLPGLVGEFGLLGLLLGMLELGVLLLGAPLAAMAATPNIIPDNTVHRCFITSSCYMDATGKIGLAPN